MLITPHNESPLFSLNTSVPQQMADVRAWTVKKPIENQMVTSVWVREMDHPHFQEYMRALVGQARSYGATEFRVVGMGMEAFSVALYRDQKPMYVVLRLAQSAQAIPNGIMAVLPTYETRIYRGGPRADSAFKISAAPQAITLMDLRASGILTHAAVQGIDAQLIRAAGLRGHSIEGYFGNAGVYIDAHARAIPAAYDPGDFIVHKDDVFHTQPMMEQFFGTRESKIRESAGLEPFPNWMNMRRWSALVADVEADALRLKSGQPTAYSQRMPAVVKRLQNAAFGLKTEGDRVLLETFVADLMGSEARVQALKQAHGPGVMMREFFVGSDIPTLDWLTTPKPTEALPAEAAGRPVVTPPTRLPAVEPHGNGRLPFRGGGR